VQFTFDFTDIAAGRKIYWVEVRKYKRHAYRFIISNQDLKKMPVTAYDATSEEGPLRYAKGVWFWNSEHTAEFLLDASILLHQCKKIDFKKHHAMFCALPGGCNDLGGDGESAAGRVMAYVLSRCLRGIDLPLIETTPKKALSTAAERGISSLCAALDAESGKLSGPLKAAINEHAVE